MMGKDVERVASGIDAVKNAASAGIVSLASATAYQLVSRDQHAGIGTGVCHPHEIEVPDGDPMAAVSAAMSAMSDDTGKVAAIGSDNYVGTTSYNNSTGSPWTEMAKLQEAVAQGAAYSGAHAPFNYVGEKAGMLALLNMIMSAAVDAKWAIITYHDYLQRGYDNKYNGNEPSVTFQVGLNRESVGNVDQDYEENVNIPRPSADPF